MGPYGPISVAKLSRPSHAPRHASSLRKVVLYFNHHPSKPSGCAQSSTDCHRASSSLQEQAIRSLRAQRRSWLKTTPLACRSRKSTSLPASCTLGTPPLAWQCPCPHRTGVRTRGALGAGRHLRASPPATPVSIPQAETQSALQQPPGTPSARCFSLAAATPMFQLGRSNTNCLANLGLNDLSHFQVLGHGGAPS